MLSLRFGTKPAGAEDSATKRRSADDKNGELIILLRLFDYHWLNGVPTSRQASNHPVSPPLSVIGDNQEYYYLAKDDGKPITMPRIVT